MKAGFKWGLAVLLLQSLALRAEPVKPVEAQDLLDQLALAAHQLAYSGIFVFQHDGGMEASRVFHDFDRGQEKTRIDTLDGPSRQIIRLNDEMRCYFPEAKAIRLEKGEGRRYFPALIASPAQIYRDNYEVSLEGQDRVAGHDCRVIALKPRDGFRFEQDLCADSASSLLLRAVTLGPQGEPLQMSVFTEVNIGAHPDATQFKPAYSGTSAWRLDTVPPLEADAERNGWVVANPPAGFHKILEVRRQIPGRASALTHLVYSDGLATVSVFIEPAEGPPKPDRSETLPNALSFYSARSGERQVTVVGEVPLVSVTQMGQSVIKLRSSRP